MSDLISREAVLAIAKDSCLDLDNWVETKIFCKEIEELPSADIMECARKIKEYCEGFLDCEGCRFDNGTFRCEFHACPCDWDLPEGEKGGD